MFKEGKTVPVAFLIHDRKNRATHEMFFRVMANVIPNLERMNTIIVTDRELAISGAIKRVFPRMKILFCWNHLGKDFKRWLISQKASSDDMEVYPRDFLTLLQCDSYDDFIEKEARLTSRWSPDVRDQFENNYRSDILHHSGKWVLDEVGICGARNGITNNISEGMNTLLKKLASWPGIPTDAVVTALYFLQRYKYNEILRGRLRVGDFQLKEIHHLDQVLEPSDVTMPTPVCTPEQIVDLIKAGTLIRSTIWRRRQG